MGGKIPQSRQITTGYMDVSESLGKKLELTGSSAFWILKQPFAGIHHVRVIYKVNP